MEKLIDFDALFEEKLTEYMKLHAGKYTEKKWEAIIPKLYQEYGDTFIKKIGHTPKSYFVEMTDERLVELLQEYSTNGIPVCDFMREELRKRNCVKALIPLVRAGNQEALNLVTERAEADAETIDACFSLLGSDCSEPTAERVIEYLKANADLAKHTAIALWKDGVRREEMAEILSCCRERDDEVLSPLLNELRASPDHLPLYAECLVRYGDDRALPVLLDLIAREDINYLEYRELKYAIEALGGEYESDRDFSEDLYYREISEQSQILPDFTEEQK